MVNRVKPGQGSVWDYPPQLGDSGRRIRVVFGSLTLAYAGRARRVPDIAGPFKGGPWGW